MVDESLESTNIFYCTKEGKPDLCAESQALAAGSAGVSA